MKNKMVKDNIFNNNAIQNSQQLSKVNKHNLRKYDNNQELINILRGSNNLYDDVKNLYKEEFERARLEYNATQTRNDRKIDNYFSHISNNKKSDLACEIIIEIGDMNFWKDKDDTYKRKMNFVFEEQIQDLEKITPSFKIASAVIHYDESSPHLHIVGVPIKDGRKNGMKKQVGKSDIFTKESLKYIQDNIRISCINSFNKIYQTNMILKDKKIGRNEDIPTQNMEKYYQLKQENDKNKKRLEDVNKKSNQTLKQSSEIKNIIDNLKSTHFNKESYTIHQEQISVINEYVKQVDNNVNEIKNINDLTIILDDFERDLENHDKQVNNLQNIIRDQDKQIEFLIRKDTNHKDKIKKQANEIKELQKEVSKLSQMIELWQDIWQKLLSFLHRKFIDSKHKNNGYDSVIQNMYDSSIIDEDDIDYISKNEYEEEKNNGMER